MANQWTWRYEGAEPTFPSFRRDWGNGRILVPWTREEADEICGDPMVHHVAMKRFREDDEFAHSPCIDRDYPGECVGIHARKVIGHAPDRTQLIAALKRQPEVDLGAVCFRDVPARNPKS